VTAPAGPLVLIKCVLHRELPYVVPDAHDDCCRYYKYEILTRTADGDEGGRHQLISAAVGNGNLYILKVQIGDKRWFKGANAFAKGVAQLLLPFH